MEQQYTRYVKRAAQLAVFISFSLILIKGIAWWKTGSIAMLAAMTDSLVDFAASFTNMLVLRFALQPADDEHHFGHGKAESIAALIQSAFITGSAVFLLLQGIQRLTQPQSLMYNTLGLTVSAIAFFLTLALLCYQHKVIKLTDSPAIKADALHYKTDLFMNGAIFVAMLLISIGLEYMDAIFAIAIALYILYSATKMLWDAVQTLLDRALPPEETAKIIEIARQNQKIIGVHDICTRRAGAVRFIQLHLELDDNLTLLAAHDIADELEQQILAHFPLSEIIIHQEPTSLVQKEGH